MVSKLKFDDDLCNFWWNKSVIGMALVSKEGNFLKVNPSLCRIVKYSSEELLRLTFQSITHASDVEADLQSAKNISSKKLNNYEMTKRYLTKLDEVVWVRIIVHGICKDLNYNCTEKDNVFLYFFVQIVPLIKPFQKNSTDKNINSKEFSTRIIKQILLDNWKIIIAISCGIISYLLNKIFFKIEPFI